MQTLELVLRDATARPSSWNAETNTVDAVIASNAPVARRDAKGPFNEVLDVNGADLSRLIGASVLDGHQAGGVRSIIGVVKAARVEGHEIVATLQMSSRPELEPVKRDIADGVIRHLSVGYSIEQVSETTEAGTRTRTATKWTPREVSFVAIPADRNAHTRTGNDNMTEIINITDRKVVNRQIRELGARSGVAAAILDNLIDNEASIDQAREEILSDIHKRGSIKISSSAAHQTTDDPEIFRTTVADAIYSRIDPGHKPSEAARQYVGLSLAEIARTCLTRNGESTIGLGADALITRALAPYSSSDFPALMANVMGKSLRIAYEAAPSGLKQVARQTSNVDFRAKMRIMVDTTAVELFPVLESGEFKSGGLVDGSESYAVNTYGTLINMSRKLMVNDDLGALSDMFRRFGVASANFEATFLTNILTSNPDMAEDGLTLFHAAHGNVAAPGGPPSVATLTAARLAMRSQTGLGGGQISVTPTTLVVGSDLETTAEQLITEIHPVSVDQVNPFSKLKSLVIEPRLPPAAWYLVAEPSEIDGLEYAYLASAPGPQLESRLGFEIDGLQTRVRLDFGGAFVDWRGWYKNPGQ
jgi:hypothetical protein